MNIERIFGPLITPEHEPGTSPQLRVGGQGSQSFRTAGDITGRKEQFRAAAPYRLQIGASGRRHHRQSSSHGLDDAQPEGFCRGSGQEDG